MTPMNERNIQIRYCDASGRYKPYLIDWVSPAELAIFCFQMTQFDWDGSAVDELLQSVNTDNPSSIEVFPIWANATGPDERYEEIQTYNKVLQQMRRNFVHIRDGFIMNKP